MHCCCCRCIRWRSFLFPFCSGLNTVADLYYWWRSGYCYCWTRIVIDSIDWSHRLNFHLLLILASRCSSPAPWHVRQHDFVGYCAPCRFPAFCKCLVDLSGAASFGYILVGRRFDYCLDVVVLGHPDCLYLSSNSRKMENDFQSLLLLLYCRHYCRDCMDYLKVIHYCCLLFHSVFCLYWSKNCLNCSKCRCGVDSAGSYLRCLCLCLFVHKGRIRLGYCTGNVVCRSPGLLYESLHVYYSEFLFQHHSVYFQISCWNLLLPSKSCLPIHFNHYQFPEVASLYPRCSPARLRHYRWHSAAMWIQGYCWIVILTCFSDFSILKQNDLGDALCSCLFVSCGCSSGHLFSSIYLCGDAFSSYWICPYLRIHLHRPSHSL